MNTLFKSLAVIAMTSGFLGLTLPAMAAKHSIHATTHKHHKTHHSHHSHHKHHTAQHGMASWYGAKFHGKRTSSGERYNMYALTAAHRTLPLHSYAQVTNLRNHRSVVVRINDRGGFHGRRAMDLSFAAAQKLGIRGVSSVEIKPLGRSQMVAQMSQKTKNTRRG